MKKYLLSLALALFALSANAKRTQATLPTDPNLHVGKLPNGLTYYILRNNTPPNRANFYLAQCVGSLQETENQRGLAHFLEHLCFNGTRHFPSNTLVAYLESLGLKFGQNINAYTGMERTVYHLNNVPTARASALDSCLLALRDWACDISFAPEEINKERGVIREEWRQRNSATARMIQRNLERLYPNSLYARRTPIGLMEIIDTVGPSTLRQYYHRWYHPQNQAVIVVGDVDVARTAKRIEALFAPIRPTKAARRPAIVPVADNAKPIVVVDSDPEQRTTLVQVFCKMPPITPAEKPTRSYYALLARRSLMMSMLRMRLAERVVKPQCPFTQAVVGYGVYLYASSKYAFQVTIMAKDGQAQAATQTVMTELWRAAKHGFTSAELARAKAEERNIIEQQYAARNEVGNNYLGNQLVEHALGGEPMPSPDALRQLRTSIVDAITPADVQQWLRKMLPTSGRNLVVLSLNPLREGANTPTEEGLLQAVLQPATANITPYEDNTPNQPLLKTLPKAGTVVSQSTEPTLGIERIGLSNGVTVLLKPTALRKGELLMTAFAPGGSSRLGQADFANARFFNRIVGSSGLGDFSSQQLTKLLTGQTANANLSLDTYWLSLNGSAAPRDAECLFQQTYLYFTALRADKQAFDNIMANSRARLSQVAGLPEMALSDSLTATLHAHNPRFANNTLADLDRVDPNRILTLARQGMANAANFTFVFVGDFQRDSLLALVCRYIASLPASKPLLVPSQPAPINERPLQHQEVPQSPASVTSAASNDEATLVGPMRSVQTYARGITRNHFRHAMTTPKANAYIVWWAKGTPYTLANIVMAEAVGQLLGMRYTQRIREEMGAAYSTDASCTLAADVNTTYLKLYGICPMKPELVDSTLNAMRAEAENMARNIDPTLLENVKRHLAKRFEERTKQNSTWLRAVQTWAQQGIDIHTNYLTELQNITPQRLQQFVAHQLMAQGNRVEVVMMPE